MTLKKILSVLMAAFLVVLICGCEETDDFLNIDPNAEVSTDEVHILKSHFIDVGQGDSELIELPNGETMLIDAGPTDSGKKVAEYISALGYDHIDYLIGTHPHADHIGGMRQIVNQFSIGQIYMPKASTNTYTYEKLMTAIKNKKYKVKAAKAGMNITSSDNLDLSVDILAPNSDTYDSLNNYSIVIMITYDGCKFLYTGDAEALSESEILKKYPDLSADVVKVGHHGSSTSSTQEWVDAVHPSYAVFSLGKDNDYHHPHSQPVKRWKKTGAEILRTDQKGTIVISTDGESIDVVTER